MKKLLVNWVESLNANLYLKCYTLSFCLYFILFLQVWIWIRILNIDPDPQSSWIRIQYGSGSGSTTLESSSVFLTSGSEPKWIQTLCLSDNAPLRAVLSTQKRPLKIILKKTWSNYTKDLSLISFAPLENLMTISLKRIN